MNAYVELLTPEQATPDNPQWHKLRREGVSASEIAAVLGISPWESPFSLYWSKVNDWRQSENTFMTAGKRAEPVIADWFADQHPDVVVHRAGLFASSERPWQLATPDRLLCDPQMHDNPFPDVPDFDWAHSPQLLVGLLECKYEVYSWDGWGDDGTDDVPVHYRAQALWQLDVMGVNEVFIAAWHGAEFRSYRIRRDERDLRVMREAGRRFLDRIDAGDPPPIDDHHATLATVKALHPDLDDTETEIPADIAAGYRRACAMETKAKAVKKRYETALRAAMGRSKKATTTGGALVASRSVFDRAGYTVAPTTVDRLNPARGSKK